MNISGGGLRPSDLKETNRFIGSRNPHGKVILFDSFEDNSLHWFPVLSVNNTFGANSTIERSFNRAYDGRASMHMKVTVALANIQAFRAFQHQSDWISMEVFFTFNDIMRTTVAGQALFFDLRYFDGANLRIFRVEHRPHYHQWTAWANNSGNPNGPTDLLNMVANNSNPSNATTNVLASNFYIPAYDDPLSGANWAIKEGWGNVKLSVDRAAQKYVSVEIDGQVYNLSGYSPVVSTATTTIPTGTRNWLSCLAIVEDTNAYTGHAYFDAVTVADES